MADLGDMPADDGTVAALEAILLWLRRSMGRAYRRCTAAYRQSYGAKCLDDAVATPTTGCPTWRTSSARYGGRAGRDSRAAVSPAGIRQVAADYRQRLRRGR